MPAMDASIGLAVYEWTSVRMNQGSLSIDWFEMALLEQSRDLCVGAEEKRGGLFFFALS